MSKQTSFSILCAVTALILAIPTTLPAFAGGDGTPENPYQISTREDLEAVNNYLAACYVLINDIDLEGVIYRQAVIAGNTDTDSTFYGTPFTGRFDGAGYVISNLRVYTPYYCGFFGKIDSEGTVESIRLENIVTSGTGYHIGNLAGDNRGSITNCRIKGYVNGGGGGIVGRNVGSITNSCSSGEVVGQYSVGGVVGTNYGSIINCWSTATINGSGSVGGLVGQNYQGGATNCYSTGMVSGRENAGGFLGSLMGGSITNCYSTGTVKGTGNNVGGFVGSNYLERGFITGCFWDIETSGLTFSSGGTGKTTAQMKDTNTFIDNGWDFDGESTNGIDDIWYIGYFDYPILSWQISFSGGDGSSDDPYRISTRTNLEAVRHNVTAHYILVNDIDLSNYTYPNAVIAPDLVNDANAEYNNTPFTGRFDGGGYIISGLKINGGDYCGLFGKIGFGGTVDRLCITNTSISGTGSYAGGLAGQNEGSVTTCYTIGSTSGTENYIGGLIGSNAGDLANCFSTSTVIGNDSVGGLIGENKGNLINSYSVGQVNGINYIGGLVGFTDTGGSVLNCFWDIETSGLTFSSGGTGKTTAQMKDVNTFFSSGWDLVDETENGIEDIWFMPQTGYPRLPWQIFSGGQGSPDDPYRISTKADLEAVNKELSAYYILTNNIDLAGTTYTQAVISGNTDTDFFYDGTPFTGRFDGGGYVIQNLTVNGSYYCSLFGKIGTIGSVFNLGLDNVSLTGTGNYIGCLAGDNLGSVNNCHSNGSVAGTGFCIGGLVGNNAGNLTNCNSDGLLSGTERVGGIAGWNNLGTIIDCYSDTSITGNEYIGGLVGINHFGSIINCYSSGSIAGTGSIIGGLVGNNEYGSITGSYSDVSINGSNYIGGLAGSNYGNVGNCYSSGPVTGEGDLVGGLIGISYEGSVTDCYSNSPVNSSGDFVGGLIGGMDCGTVTNCYSSGYVDGTNYIGGLLGFNSNGIVINCFWDILNSEIVTSAAGKPKTTDEMMNPLTFSGWNDGKWRINAGSDYPRLAWENQQYSLLETDYPARSYSGSGTEDDPFVLLNSTDILSMSKRVPDWNSNFILGKDIDMYGISDYYPITEFGGTLDGRGHCINNLTISSQVIGSNYNLGLIGILKGKIYDLKVENVSITSTGEYLGAITSSNIEGSIENCYSSGTVIGKGDYIGGLAGDNAGSLLNCHSTYLVTTNGCYAGALVGSNSDSLTNCYSDGSVTGSKSIGGLAGANSGNIAKCYSKGSSTGFENVGGLVGYNSRGSVTNCYSNCSVSGDCSVGGLIGYNEWRSTVAKCYSTGLVSGIDHVGGLVGYLGWAANSFWNIETSGMATSDAGTGLTTAQMQDSATFTDAGWDYFGEDLNGNMELWYQPADSYPMLYWQAADGDINCDLSVDVADLGVIADYWLLSDADMAEGYRLLGDADGSGAVDMLDVSAMSGNWLAAD
jgi:hypothetical protein